MEKKRKSTLFIVGVIIFIIGFAVSIYSPYSVYDNPSITWAFFYTGVIIFSVGTLFVWLSKRTVINRRLWFLSFAVILMMFFYLLFLFYTLNTNGLSRHRIETENQTSSKQQAKVIGQEVQI